MLKPFKVFYCLRSDFFHHNHIHRRKIEALRLAGIPASLISFVTDAEREKYRAEYENTREKYDTRLIRIPAPAYYSRKARFIMRQFFATQFLLYRRVLVHFLLSDPQPLYRLRRFPFFRGRLKMIVEYEGDLPAEWLYWETVDRESGPFEEPPDDLARHYRWMLERQSREIDNADALVVASKEHLSLLCQRMGRELCGVVFPPLFDPVACRFFENERSRIRGQLGFGESIALVHLGGVFCEWHRFPEICRLVSELLRSGSDVRLLGLILKTELEEARAHVERAGISGRTILVHVPAEEVSQYLSAADVGLFLRHHHTMTRIVSSAKLGEYLACGLPVVSTGAHAVFNRYMEESGMMISIPDSLEMPPGFEAELERTGHRAQDPDWRSRLSAGVIEEFCVKQDPTVSYVRLCRHLLA